MEAVYNVGDVCQVKELEELMEEFGEDIVGTQAGWNSAMNEMCGKVFTISEVIAGRHPRYRSVEGVENCRRQHFGGGFPHWNISGDMLKP